MRMTKEKAQELLDRVDERLREARTAEKLAKQEVLILECAKAYLEFIISGLKRNPSLKVKLEDE